LYFLFPGRLHYGTCCTDPTRSAHAHSRDITHASRTAASWVTGVPRREESTPLAEATPATPGTQPPGAAYIATERTRLAR